METFLSIDKLSITADVLDNKKVSFTNWLEEGLQGMPVGDKNQYWLEVKETKPSVGYRYGVQFERDGETVRLDFDPWRHKRGERIDPVELAKLWAGAYHVAEESDPFEDHEWMMDNSLAAYEGELKQYEDNGPISYLRVEGNPNKAPWIDPLMDRVSRYFCWDHMRLARPGLALKPSRIDIAIDYPLPVSFWGMNVVRKRKLATYQDGKNFETFNLGAAGSDQVTMYDKHRQCEAKGEKLPQHLIDVAKSDPEMWAEVCRVEARVRSMKNKDRKQLAGVSELSELSNPFSSVEIFDMDSVRGSTDDWKDVMVAAGVEKYGVQSVLRMMPRQTAKRYREKWQEEGFPVPHPQKVFNQKFQAALDAQLPSLARD